MTPDLERLWKQARKLRWVFSEIEFSLIDDPAFDPWDLRENKRLSRDVAANTAAMIATNDLISWFGREGGGFVGLWRGPSNHALVDAPVVRLDSEGQYQIRATNVADYVAGATRNGVFTEVRRELVAAGFKVARSRDAIHAQVDNYDKSNEPNAHRNRLYYANLKAAKKSAANKTATKTTRKKGS